MTLYIVHLYICEVGKIRKCQTTNYAIVYFFTMSYKYILTFQSFTLLDYKKHMTYSSCYIALHPYSYTYIHIQIH